MVNKYLTLGGTLFMFLAFFSTIRVTATNPSGTNLLISGALLFLSFYGFKLYIKPNKEKKNKVGEFTPVED